MNNKEISQWLFCNSSGTFNFHPNVRPLQLELHIQGFNETHNASRLIAMSKPVFQAIQRHCGVKQKPAIVFVPSRKQAKITAIDLVTYAAAAIAAGSFFFTRRCYFRKLRFPAQGRQMYPKNPKV